MSIDKCANLAKLFLFSRKNDLGVAGMCSKTAVAPLDRIKILLQAHSNHYKHLGVFSGLRHIVRKESFVALYKGNSAQMVRIFPYAATQFTAFEFYKRVSHQRGIVNGAMRCAITLHLALSFPFFHFSIGLTRFALNFLTFFRF